MSRRDVIELIPDVLDSSFVIVIDDADRLGEKRTINDIELKLKKTGIESYTGFYSGLTKCCVIVSKDNRYFCTL